MSRKLPQPFIEPRPADLRAELAASACLEECRRALGLRKIPIPVPVEEWIEYPLGIDFGFQRMRGADRTILGFAALDKNIIRISNAIAENSTRVRWTAAHELGHLRLHDPTTPLMSSSDPGYYDIYKNEAERQAERFAGAFLMPIHQLVKAMFQICRDSNLNSKRTISTLMSNNPQSRALWHETFLPGLCTCFAVSRPGALFRLGELRLFDGKRFILPDTLIMLSTKR